MRNIDEKAVRAKNEEKYLETFINEYEVFIIHTAHKAAGKFITKRDDEWSVGLSAFHEAIKSYDFDKGAFLPFADTVIRRRIYDYRRKQSKHDCEIPIDSYSMENDENSTETSIKAEVMEKTSVIQQSDVQMEIEILKQTLNGYGISFFDLAESSPKAEKTKIVCAKAIEYIWQNPILTAEMKKTKTLPLKIIEKNLGLPRKVLERHRKYIITAVEIVSGDYEILSEYFRFVRKGHGK